MHKYSVQGSNVFEIAFPGRVVRPAETCQNRKTSNSMKKMMNVQIWRGCQNRIFENFVTLTHSRVQCASVHGAVVVVSSVTHGTVVRQNAGP